MSYGWEVVYWQKDGELLGDRYMQVLPINDIKQHQEGDECWCHPRVWYAEDGDETPIITHHAADKREESEDIS